jgi:hypothetical protein
MTDECPVTSQSGFQCSNATLPGGRLKILKKKVEMDPLNAGSMWECT